MESNDIEDQYEKDVKILAKHSFSDASLIVENDFESIYKCFVQQGGKDEHQIKEQRYIDVVQSKLLSFQERQIVRQEINRLKHINHPNITKVISFIEEKSVIMCVYPYNINIYLTLGKLIRTNFNQINPCERWVIVKGIIDGLTQFHKQGRPFKYLNPENILINEDNDSQITFRIGNMLNLHLEKYIAPQVRDGLQTSLKADIWSFDLVLLELVTGLPYRIIHFIFSEKYLNDIGQLDKEGQQFIDNFISQKIKQLEYQQVSKQSLRRFLLKMFHSQEITISRLIYRMLLKKPQDRPDLQQVSKVIRMLFGFSTSKLRKRKIQEKKINVNLFERNRLVLADSSERQQNEKQQKEQIQPIKPIQQQEKDLPQTVTQEIKVPQTVAQEIKVQEEKPQTVAQELKDTFFNKNEKDQNLTQTNQENIKMIEQTDISIKVQQGSSLLANSHKYSTQINPESSPENESSLTKIIVFPQENIENKQSANKIQRNSLIYKSQYLKVLQINEPFYSQALMRLKQIQHPRQIQTLYLMLTKVSIYLCSVNGKISQSQTNVKAESGMTECKSESIIQDQIRVIYYTTKGSNAIDKVILKKTNQLHKVTKILVRSQILSANMQFLSDKDQFLQSIGQLTNLRLLQISIRHNLTKHQFFCRLVETINSLPFLQRVYIYIDESMQNHQSWFWPKRIERLAKAIYVRSYGKGRRSTWNKS